MIYQVKRETLIDYFGIQMRTLYDWHKKSFNVYEFYYSLLQCNSYKCQKQLFYTVLSSDYTENKIDIAWNRFINKRLESEELEAEKRRKKKNISKLKEEKKEGRIL